MKNVKALCLLLFLVFLITGCTASMSSEIDFLSVFPTEDKVSLYYHGLAEYGHILTVDNHTETDKGSIISYNGIMDGGEEGDDLTFSVQYVIEDDRVIEKVDLDFDYKDSNETLNSIISNKVILQGEIAKGHSWTSNAIFDGVERNVTTTITEVEHLSNGIIVFTTETVIDDLEGYFYGGKYKEIRTYAEGYGLIGFQNTLPLLTDEKGDELDTFYEFGYGLTGYTKEPFSSYENLIYDDIYKATEELEEYFNRVN